MTTTQENTAIDLRKKPYRGVLSEIAREQGVSRIAIHQAIHKYQNPRIIAIYMNKIDAIRATIQKFQTGYTN